MSSINKVFITGNLTREPEQRETAGGMAVVKFCVAVNEARKNQQTGEWEDYPHFVDCAMFGKRAAGVCPYLHKGGRVAIEGKLNFSKWETKDGQKRSKLEVVVAEIVLMQNANNNAQQQGAPNAYAPQQTQQGANYGVQTPQAQGAPQPQQDTLDYGDEIPF